MNKKVLDELIELKLENPNARALVEVSEETHKGEHSVECIKIDSVRLEQMTLYNETWLDEEELKEVLVDSIPYDDYNSLSEDEIDKLLDEKLKNYKFEAIIFIRLND